jgi:hypothetical protein
MAALVAYGFSPKGGGRRAQKSEAPAPPPFLSGEKQRVGFQVKVMGYQPALSSFHILGGIWGKSAIRRFSIFLQQFSNIENCNFWASMLGLGYRANFIFWGSIMYSPNFSELAAVTVRRLAWAMGANMGQAVDVLVKALPAYIKTDKVCELCKDKTKCNVCAIKNCGEMPQKAKALLY